MGCKCIWVMYCTLKYIKEEEVFWGFFLRLRSWCSLQLLMQQSVCLGLPLVCVT